MSRDINSLSTYKDVLIKLIPSEIVAAYMVIDGLIPSQEAYAKWLALIVSIILAILTPIYLRILYKVKSWSQTWFTTGTFVIWVYWLGGPFRLWDIHYPPIASVMLVLWTLLIPFLNLPSRFSVGQSVHISRGKLADVIVGDYIHAWNSRKMARYRGKAASIIKIDRRRKSARLNIDNGENVWSFDWLENIPDDKVGGSNDTESK